MSGKEIRESCQICRDSLLIKALHLRTIVPSVRSWVSRKTAGMPAFKARISASSVQDGEDRQGSLQKGFTPSGKV